MTLTREEKRVRIAEALNMADRWVLKKRGLYYRPNAHGYTGDILEAWIITEAEADKHVYPHDEPVTKHRAPLPDFFGSLDACHEMEKAISTSEQRADFSRHLIQILNDALRNTPRFIGPSSFDQTHAAAEHRAEAFGRTLNLWNE